MVQEEQDYKLLRENMVEFQIKSRRIENERVLKVMKEIPRHLFIPQSQRLYAYEDFPIPIGEGQTISQPYIVALMTEALQLKGDEKVLEIGTGSGYQAAILSKLSKEVYTTENIKSLALNAEELFIGLGYKNIKLKVADGTEGWAEYSPYNGIIVTAGAPQIPEPLIEQLAENGRIVIPVGDSFSQGLVLGEKIKGRLITKTICGCVFVPLVGKYGWQK
jgi:protein-L-isoaspartate(D-aspartate) O-methyltransferase